MDEAASWFCSNEVVDGDQTDHNRYHKGRNSQQLAGSFDQSSYGFLYSHDYN